MTTFEFNLSYEQQKELHEACERVAQAAREIVDIFVNLAQKLIDAVREAAISLARFFLKCQLVEWKLPYPIADLISRNVSSYWAMRFGFNWFVRKYALKE